MDDNYGMDEFLRPQIAKVFPELEFIELPPSHPIFHQTFDFDQGLPKVHEHDDGRPQALAMYYEGRMVCLYTLESDLGDGWEDPRVHNDPESVHREALQMGAMDYLIKAKFDEFELAKCISYALYRKHREVELQTMALKDTLTGLGNRVLFEENLRMSVERAKRSNENLGVLYIDLDGFKDINDTHGHAGGDAILKSVSERIVDQTRESDVVARIGGDEFAAVLVRVDKPESVHTIAQSVENAISSTPYIIDGEEVSMSASVGASIFPSDTSDIEDLVKMADMRMYGSKKAKKARLAQPESNVRIYQTAEIRDLSS